MSKISAEYLNSLPRFKMDDLGRPAHVVPGQVWTLRDDITEWAEPGNIPPLFPVVITGQEADVFLPGLSARHAAPVHHLRENAASDDLFCDDKDGPLSGSDYMIAAWAQMNIFEGHLDKYLGTISQSTRNRLSQLIRGNGDADLRLHTGASIAQPLDFRRQYRLWFMDQIKVMSAPVFQCIAALEHIGDAARAHHATQVETMMRQAEVRIEIESLCDEVGELVVRTAGVDSFEKLASQKLIDLQIDAYRAKFGRHTPEAFNKIVPFLIRCFRDTLKRYPLDRLMQECGEWK